MKTDNVSKNDIAFGVQLHLMATGLPGYATTLGIAQDRVDVALADDKYFDYCLKYQSVLLQDGRQATAWRDLMRGGDPLPKAATSAGINGAPIPSRTKWPPLFQDGCGSK